MGMRVDAYHGLGPRSLRSSIILRHGTEKPWMVDRSVCRRWSANKTVKDSFSRRDKHTRFAQSNSWPTTHVLIKSYQSGVIRSRLYTTT